MAKKAFITGITGQDGSYLSELLLEKGYEVYGLVRRVAFEDEMNRMGRLIHIKDKLHLIPGSLESFPSIYKAIADVSPDEVYHLAAQSYVSYSFEDEFSTLNSNINGTHYILSACKNLVPKVKFYFAASSEQFGQVKVVPQNEDTPFHPRSPYGISKVAGFELTRNYREGYNMFACSGILFNHESPRRGLEFVTRKITSHVAKIKLGLADHLELGNLDAKRDWGHAKEYVQAMWLMLQQDTPDDYVVATGESHSVREFVEIACTHMGLDYRKVVKVNPKFYRPAEVNVLQGDASKAKKKLGIDFKVSFEALVKEMVEHDLELCKSRMR